MDITEGTSGPELEDFLSEGRAMEESIELSEGIAASQHDTTRKLASQCRRHAVGVIAIALSFIEDACGGGPVDDKTEYLIACICGFAQDAPVSSKLIT
jgi:hypothetical protein